MYNMYMQAHVRLNHLGITVSPDATLKKLDELGQDHDGANWLNFLPPQVIMN